MDIKDRVRRKSDWKKASFTIEATFLIPFVLFLMWYVLQIGIGFFQESIMRETYDRLSEFQAVERFYTIQRWKDFMEDK